MWTDGESGAYTRDIAAVMRDNFGFQHAVLVELELDEGRRERRGVDRAVYRLQQVRHRSDMVFMAVRQDQAADLLRVQFEIGDVGIDDVHPIHAFIGKTHPRIHNDDVIRIFEHRHILADLTETAKRDDL